MSSIRNLLVLVIVTSVPASASANGMLYRLPADGASAVYEMNMESKTNLAMLTGTLTMSSVGKAKAGGKDCRWIEFTMVMSQNGKERTVNAKMLVPEEDLGKGKNPFNNPQKGWVAFQGREPKKINDFTSRDAGPLPAFLAGPLQEVTKLDEKEIETPAGKLKCAGEKGTRSYVQGTINTVVTYTNRLHSKSPFGVAKSTMTIKETRDGKVREESVLTFSLVSVGKGAKSKLPEQN